MAPIVVSNINPSIRRRRTAVFISSDTQLLQDPSVTSDASFSFASKSESPDLGSIIVEL